MTAILTSVYLPMIAVIAGAATTLVFASFGLRRLALQSGIYGMMLGAAVALVEAQLQEGLRSMWVFGSAMVAAAFILGAVLLAGSFRWLLAHRSGTRIASLMSLAVAAAGLMCVVSDLLMLFLAVEALALAGYGIIALSRTDRAREATMKWFIQGSVATAIFIVGLGVLAVETGGVLSYTRLYARASEPVSSVALAVGFVLVFVALAFKAGAFPFHSWMPDAFETGPAPGVAVLASIGKLAPLTALTFLVLAVSGVTGGRVETVLGAVAAGSIVFGNLVALRQKSLARMLGYSGVAQVGYGMVGLVAGAGALTVLLFAALYALTSAGAFMLIVALNETEPGWNGSIPGLAGLSKRQPVIAATLAVVMFSLTGLPLFAGFWGKLAVLSAATGAGWVWLTLIAMLGSVVSFGYYGGVVRAAFIADDPTAEEPWATEDGASGTAPVIRVTGDAHQLTEIERRGGWPAPSVLIAVAIAMLVVVIGVVPLFIGTGAS